MADHFIKPEVLAPAGDMESLRAAVLYGADAVYLGAKQFGMRSSSSNFDEEELAEAVSYCHANQVKVYLTCNTLPSSQEIELLPAFLQRVADCGIDALIIADIGVFMLAKRVVPQIELHISTQAGVFNYETACELHKLGASRVVLARELSLEDITVIRQKTPPTLSIETFVHGSMCMSISGRCVLSQYLTGRDANRGQCSQPCRWKYYLMEEKRPGQYFPILEDDSGSYILNAQDLCMLPYLDRLVQAGATSLKIEGRAKSAYYTAVITNAYRMAVDLLAKDPTSYVVPDWLLEETQKVSHRHYSTGFYLQDSPPSQYYENGGYIRDWEVIAIVEDWQDGSILCTERNRFCVGEEVELLVPKEKPIAFTIDQILDEDNVPLSVARNPMRSYRIPFAHPVPAGSMLRRLNKQS